MRADLGQIFFIIFFRKYHLGEGWFNGQIPTGIVARKGGRLTRGRGVALFRWPTWCTCCTRPGRSFAESG